MTPAAPSLPALGDVARRRFLLLAAAAATGALAGCGTPVGAGRAPRSSSPAGPSPAATGSSAGSSSTGPSSTPTARVAAPQALRGTGARRAPGPPAAALDALAGFGADVLRTARRLDPGTANTALSPSSLFRVLAMVRAGARGATAAQIDATLRCAGPQAQGAVVTAIDAGVAAALAAARQQARPGDDPLVVTSSDQVWVQDGFAVHQEYLDALAVQFGLHAVGADFAGDPERMRSGLNAWVADRTHDLVPELFPEGSITPDTVLVLVNALYLKAAWADRFTPAGERDFTTARGTRVRAPMMGTRSADGTAGDGWTAATVPYRGNRLVMTVLVPDAGRFDAVLAGLDGELVRRATRRERAVDLTMPLFRLASDLPAEEIARELGIEDLFTPRADLTGIAAAPLMVSQLLHQAVVTVDEKGTEAAAATAAVVVEMSLPAPGTPLVVDRPFLFWISETTTGAPLFLGAVTDPTA